MLRIRPLFLLLAALTALAVPTGAEACVPTTSEADVEAAGYYVDDLVSCTDRSFPWCTYVCIWQVDVCLVETGLWYSWVYQESNGIPGLQRHDDMWDDTCGGLIPGDTVVY